MDASRDVAETFLRAEQSGLKLAIIGQSYTVHGDAVNLAARLEALCKEHGTSLLLSASTAKALPEVTLVVVGDIPVRGRAKPVTVFSIPTED